MSRMDLTLGDYMTQIRRQAATKKISSFETVGRGNPAVPIDVVPSQATVTPMIQKQGQPTQMSQQNI